MLLILVVIIVVIIVVDFSRSGECLPLLLADSKFIIGWLILSLAVSSFPPCPYACNPIRSKKTNLVS